MGNLGTTDEERSGKMSMNLADYRHLTHKPYGILLDDLCDGGTGNARYIAYRRDPGPADIYHDILTRRYYEAAVHLARAWRSGRIDIHGACSAL